MPIFTLHLFIKQGEMEASWAYPRFHTLRRRRMERNRLDRMR
jgi:hypothetical protein